VADHPLGGSRVESAPADGAGWCSSWRAGGTPMPIAPTEHPVVTGFNRSRSGSAVRQHPGEALRRHRVDHHRVLRPLVRRTDAGAHIRRQQEEYHRDVSARRPRIPHLSRDSMGEIFIGSPTRVRLMNGRDWTHSNDLVRNPQEDGGGIGRGGGARGVCSCRSGAGGSRSWCLRQRAVRIRISMRRRARMGRLGSGSQLGPARTDQECMVPLEPARSLEGRSTRYSLQLECTPVAVGNMMAALPFRRGGHLRI